MHLVFDYDQTKLRLIGVEQGAMFNTATGRAFFAVRPGVENIDINAVSLDAAFSKNEVAVLTFEAISNTNVVSVDENLTARDRSNEDIEVAFSTNPVSDRSAIVPSTYGVSQNYPNPFNPSTKIDISLPEAGAYKLEIFNTLGQKVTTFDGYSDAGIVTVEWLASESASGVYFYRLTANSYRATKKMALLK